MFKQIDELLIKKKADRSLLFFGIFNNKYFWETNQTIFFYEREIGKLLKFGNLTRSLLLGNSYLYLENKIVTGTERRLMNLKDLNISMIDKEIKLYSCNTEYCIGIHQSTGDTVALTMSDFKELWKKEGKHYFVQHEEFTFSNRPYDLALYDNASGDLIWHFPSFSQFDYEEKIFTPPERRKAMFKTIFCVYNDIVWLSVDPGRILGLSITNGELKYNITQPKSYPKDHNPKFERSSFFGAYSQFDEQRGMLFGLLHEEYWEIDLNNPDEGLMLYSFKESCKKFGLIADGNIRQPFTNDEMFFYSGYLKENAIGVFDRNKKEIIWAAPLKKSLTGFHPIRRMEYSNDKLYVVTDDWHLIVYQRE